MLSYASDTGWVFDPFQATLFAIFVIFEIYRRRVRTKSLRQKDNGMYVWVEWHGGERSSWDDPSALGGEWDSECDGGGGGD